MMPTVTVERVNGKLHVASPYNVDLPEQAKMLGGRWIGSKKRWAYRDEAETEVRALYLDVYGDWPGETSESVTLLCLAGDSAEMTCESLTLCGRPIARAFGRDSGARVADGVVIVSGNVGSGGSRKNWTTHMDTGSVFKLLDVTQIVAERLIADPEWCEKIEIIEGSVKIDLDALREERARLTERLVEIDNIIYGTE